jgi:hypothetical protein
VMCALYCIIGQHVLRVLRGTHCHYTRKMPVELTDMLKSRKLQVHRPRSVCTSMPRVLGIRVEVPAPCSFLYSRRKITASFTGR